MCAGKIPADINLYKWGWLQKKTIAKWVRGMIVMFSLLQCMFKKLMIFLVLIDLKKYLKCYMFWIRFIFLIKNILEMFF